MEVKCGRNTDKNGCREARPMLKHPALLFGRAKFHPNYIGPRTVD
jgi:hypothetical protein